MKLIVDSGSTKATWVLLPTGNPTERFQSQGMNPALLSDSDIVRTVKERIPEELKGKPVKEVCFYAAGCRGEREASAICTALHEAWTDAETFAASDILGAARAVCGTEPGVAAILGTGSNCAVYHPEKGIVAATPPLGYILGDEGSGADIGKTMVNAALKGLWSKELKKRFLNDHNLDQNTIIEKVYREPEPNRFLASLALWAKENICDRQVEELVISRFTAFLRHNLSTLPDAKNLPAGFVGSIAAGFEPQLRKACAMHGVAVGKIYKSPADGLEHFHRNNK